MIKIDMRKKRNEPNEERIRLNLTIDPDTHSKLKKMGISCEIPKSTMAYEFLKFCVNHEQIIEIFQNRYNENPQYKVVPIKQNGKIFY
ncbi:hypothetical protein [Schinkia azotoformans]|uniref:hypothetical protein n=1 Tax=Schinkia azotoformans TaxID=1454 RepID=UPI002DBC4FF8|nr:hypothetical protein [Schinkia azotoformans]MEC1757354.1 hypothetical protein [Schinkia azotoformans]